MANDKPEVAVKKSANEQKSGLQRYSSRLEEMSRMFDDLFQRRFFALSLMPRLKLPDYTDVPTSVDMFEEGDDLIIKSITGARSSMPAASVPSIPDIHVFSDLAML